MMARTSSNRTEIDVYKRQVEDKPRRAISAFWVPFFSKKGTGVQGQRPWSLTAVSEMLQAKEAQEWVNF